MQIDQRIANFSTSQKLLIRYRQDKMLNNMMETMSMELHMKYRTEGIDSLTERELKTLYLITYGALTDVEAERDYLGEYIDRHCKEE